MTRNSKKADYQTVSLFIALGLLTAVFLLGLRWVFFTPVGQNTNMPTVEATK